jgi:hypothetical protein
MRDQRRASALTLLARCLSDDTRIPVELTKPVLERAARY